jgi:dTDP-4-dehydrorhamnose reductase
VNKTRAVLIIGGSGFLGTHLALKLRDGYKVFATYAKNRIEIPGVTNLPLNVGNRSWLKRVFQMSHPDIIIYCAGSNVIAAQDTPSSREAELVHTTGVASTTAVFEQLQQRLIYISNCYVFDGNRGNYHESDIALPNTSLGKSKLAGENNVRSKVLNNVIVRSSPIFGRGNGLHLSFMDRIRMTLDRGQKIELSVDELHSFVSIYGFTDCIARILESGLRNKILHYGGLTKVSYFDFGRSFAKFFGYNSDLIIPKSSVASKKKGVSGEQPRDFSLNSSQANQTLKINTLLLEESFDLIQKQLVRSL